MSEQIAEILTRHDSNYEIADTISLTEEDNRAKTIQAVESLYGWTKVEDALKKAKERIEFQIKYEAFMGEDGSDQEWFDALDAVNEALKPIVGS